MLYSVYQLFNANYMSNYKYISGFGKQTLLLVLILIVEINYSRFKVVIWSTLVQLLIIITVLTIYNVAERWWLIEIINFSFSVIWGLSITATFVMSLDQIEPVKERYVYCLYTCIFSFFTNYTIKCGSFLVVTYTDFWTAKEHYYIDFIPMIAILVLAVVMLFISRNHITRVYPPLNNVLVDMYHCLKYSRYVRRYEEEGHRQPFFEAAKEYFGPRIVSDIKRLYALFMLIPIFFVSNFAFCDIQYFMTVVLKARLWDIPYEQYQLFSVLLQLGTYPVCITVIILMNLNCTPIVKTHLRRFYTGILLIILGLGIHLGVVKSIDDNKGSTPPAGHGNVAIVNTLSCTMEVKIPLHSMETHVIPSLTHKIIKNFMVSNETRVQNQIKCGDRTRSSFFDVLEGSLTVFFFKDPIQAVGYIGNLLFYILYLSTIYFHICLVS